jgi:hypothetical protein
LCCMELRADMTMNDWDKLTVWLSSVSTAAAIQ